jgi:hypothetical protein
MSKKGTRGQYLIEKIPVGALVKVTVYGRPFIPELGIVIECNYGLYENSWYIVYGIKSGREYFTYPDELEWLKMGVGEEND